ncbi:MAG: hypothetical protein WAS21_29950 [Geminicoccaceae bacterium]
MNVVPYLSLASDALPDITRRDRARFVKEARRLRAAELDRLFRAAGRGVVRLGRALGAPLTRRQLIHE